MGLNLIFFSIYGFGTGVEVSPEDIEKTVQHILQENMDTILALRYRTNGWLSCFSLPFCLLQAYPLALLPYRQPSYHVSFFCCGIAGEYIGHVRKYLPWADPMTVKVNSSPMFFANRIWCLSFSYLVPVFVTESRRCKNVWIAWPENCCWQCKAYQKEGEEREACQSRGEPRFPLIFNVSSSVHASTLILHFCGYFTRRTMLWKLSQVHLKRSSIHILYSLSQAKISW